MLVMPAAAASADPPAMLVEVSTRNTACTLVRTTCLLLLLLVTPERGEDSELLVADGDMLPVRLPLRLPLGDMETDAAGLGRWKVGIGVDAVVALPAWLVGMCWVISTLMYGAWEDAVVQLQ